jgi:molybdate transport system permease protein
VKSTRETGLGLVGLVLGGLLGLALLLPIFALVASTSVADIRSGVAHPLFAPALVLSLETTTLSLGLTLLTGTPIAWWLATSQSRLANIATVLVDLPIVLPPAVTGVALLAAFGRQGLLGPLLGGLGLGIPFTEAAVVLAQVVVSAPFFVQAASNAFRQLDLDMLTVARTLGATPATTFLRVVVPIALPGLIVGASLAWARALGEFGATLLFAGNLSGTTQTMPLAIFTALESDVRVAVVFSIVLVALGAVLLLVLRSALAVSRVRASMRDRGKS